MLRGGSRDEELFPEGIVFHGAKTRNWWSENCGIIYIEFFWKSEIEGVGIFRRG